MLCFDKVNRTFYYQKLLTEKVSRIFVRAVKAMYTIVKSCVKFNSESSKFFTSYTGLNHGHPGSLLLFMYFVNDAAHNINTNIDDTCKYFYLLYDDDKIIYARSPEPLQPMIYDLVTYLWEWGSNN
jgi:hypothetical protein